MIKHMLCYPPTRVCYSVTFIYYAIAVSSLVRTRMFSTASPARSLFSCNKGERVWVGLKPPLPYCIIFSTYTPQTQAVNEQNHNLYFTQDLIRCNMKC